MDQDWKNQNQAPDEDGQTPVGPAPPPAPGPSTVITPAAPTPNPAGEPVPPQPAQAFPPAPNTPYAANPQNIYDQYSPQASASKKKIIIAAVIVAVLVVAGGAYALLSKHQNQKPGASNTQLPVTEKNPVVPASWKSIDVLGFTVKAPANWSGANSVPTDSTFGIYKSKTTLIGAPANTSDNSTVAFSQYVGLGTESITTSKSQADFEKAITDVNQVADSLSGFGISKDQVKMTSSKVNINGKEWLQVDSEIPHQFSTSLYFWVNDHAVYLNASNANKDQLDSLVNDYLLPMAASLELNSD